MEKLKLQIRIEIFKIGFEFLKKIIDCIKMVAWGGLEPPTKGFSVLCSTN
jgi:hypothetical protein